MFVFRMKIVVKESSSSTYAYIWSWCDIIGSKYVVLGSLNF